MTDDEDHMVKISDLISRLQVTKDQFGDTCVYIRRGGLAWGAVALNRRDDDKKHGVFDLQAQHDRDMLQRVEQVGRLIASRRSAEERLAEAVNNHDALVKALEDAKAALFKIRACSIAGCEEGYGRPEKWADALFASHADVAASLKTIDGLLAVVGNSCMSPSSLSEDRK